MRRRRLPRHHHPAAAYVAFANNVWTPGSLPTVADQPSPSQGHFVDLACPGVRHCFADADYEWENEYFKSLEQTTYARSTDLNAMLAPN